MDRADLNASPIPARRRQTARLAIAALAATWMGGAMAAEPDLITSLPGLGATATPHYAGYASVAEAPCAGLLCDGHGEQGLFYWLVTKHADGAPAPTILWTNGGPGSTSFWGFFTENGPYAVDPDGTLAERSFAWNKSANYLIFDHPLGVGLSFAPDEALPGDVRTGVDQWYRALVHLVERHPELAAEPLLLAGESYGGTYVPLLARAILDGNRRAGREVVRLGGIVLAAPWVDPVVGQSMDTTYAYSHGLIGPGDKAALDAVFAECQALVAAATPSTREANATCSKLKSGIAELSGRYLLNIAEEGDPPTDQVAAWLNRPDVRAAIHARPQGTFSFFSEPIGDRYEIGGQDSYRWAVQEVLDAGVPVMVVSGLNDATDVNFLGVRAWLALLTGDRAAAYAAAPRTQWKDEAGAVLGYLQSGGGLTTVEILGAGHLAAADQPRLIDLIRETLLPGR
jgi:cathepsin A (carboxypeptidase C)